MMQRLNKIIFLCSLLLAMVVVRQSTADAWQLQGSKWPQPSATFYVDIPVADGAWNSAFEEAMSYWSVDTVFKFDIVRGAYSDPCDPDDTRNGVGFDSTVCGDAWGSKVIAVTHYSYNGSMLCETNIVFNSKLAWDIYSSSWTTVPWPFGRYDFERVAVHELGHALGLGHDDSGVAVECHNIVD